MLMRLASSGLWGFVAFTAWEIAWSVFGIAREPGLILGLLVGALVLLDPRGTFWRTRPVRSTPRLPEPANVDGSPAIVSPR